MPWYTDPTTTCRLLNRLANRYEQKTLMDLKVFLDRATVMIWLKQERYYGSHQHR